MERAGGSIQNHDGNLTSDLKLNQHSDYNSVEDLSLMENREFLYIPLNFYMHLVQRNYLSYADSSTGIGHGYGSKCQIISFKEFRVPECGSNG